MSKIKFVPGVAALLLLVCALPVAAQNSRSFKSSMFGVKSLLHLIGDSDRERDGLNGPVRRIRTETAKLSNKSGKSVEGARAALEVAAYDIKGNKIENAYFPIPGAALTGKEVYKYDDKGNIIEMTLLNADGSLASKEIYTYEFDFAGNWTRMTTSVAVIENGKLSFEPTEVTYRTITYYLDDNLTKLMQAAQAATPAPASNPTPASNAGTTTSAAAPNSTATPNSNVAANSTAPSNSSAPREVAANKPVVNTASDPAKSSSPPSSSPAASVVKASATVTADKGATLPSSVPKNESAASAPAKNDKESSAVKSESNNKTVKSEAEQAAPPVVKPPVRPISGGVLNGKATSLPVPEYPAQARNARASGLVVIEVVIDASGKVISARAISGPVLLQQAAVQAAYRAKFSPTILSGQPVKVTGTINYNFALAK